jgi:hypothetical protein
MTKRYLTTLETGELAELAQRLNSMVDSGELLVLFQPGAAETSFKFQALESTRTGERAILAIAKVAKGF